MDGAVLTPGSAARERPEEAGISCSGVWPLKRDKPVDRVRRDDRGFNVSAARHWRAPAGEP